MIWKSEDITRVINEFKTLGIAANRLIFEDDGKHITVLTKLDPATEHLAQHLKGYKPHYVKTIDVQAEPVVEPTRRLNA